MTFLTMGLVQKATWWSKGAADSFGADTFAAPAVISCRWEERSTEIVTAEGVRVQSRARVFLDQDVAAGDYLYLGETNQADPKALKGAFDVKEFRKIPGLVAEVFERKAYL